MTNKLINGAIGHPKAPVHAKIKIYTLGTLQVVRDDKAVTESDWHTRQARQLLKILITERPRPVSTDRLIEILWPDSTPNAAATTLRSAINALRNVLEPNRRNRAPSEYIVTETPGYAFNEHPDIWLDVTVFEQTLNQAEHTPDTQARRTLLEIAADLYKDDYLISDPYADWVQTERERCANAIFRRFCNWPKSRLRWAIMPPPSPRAAACWRAMKCAKMRIRR
ncbi:MAG: winged helix-turn-helix domain-containing protein [Caldilineaceae bacterium]